LKTRHEISTGQYSYLEMDILLLEQEQERLETLAHERIASGINIPRVCRLVYVLYPGFFFAWSNSEGDFYLHR